MSAAVVEKPTDIIICDICGAEITPEELNDGSSYGKLIGTVPSETVEPVELANHKLVQFSWPSYTKKIAARKQRAEDAGLSQNEEWKVAHDPIYDRKREYDLHAECVAGLLDAAVDLRIDVEAKRRRAAETVAKRNAKIIADAESRRAKSPTRRAAE